MSLYDKASLIFSGAAGAGNDEVAYNIKPVEKLKVDELVENGSFDDDSAWTKNTGVTISGGKANFSGSDYKSISQRYIFEAGKTYKISLEADITEGGFVAGTNLNESKIITGSHVDANGSGKYSVYYTALEGEDKLVVKRGRSPYDFTIDNVSVREVEQEANDLSFVRASDLTATYEGADGLIKKTRENLLTYSNDFDNAIWPGSSTWTSGQSGYDGSSNAWSFNKSSPTGSDYYNQFFHGLHTFSIYAKKQSSAGLAIYAFYDWNGSSFDYNRRVIYNLDTGTELSNQSGVISTTCEAVGSDWWRISMTMEQDDMRWYLYTTDGTETLVDNVTVTLQDAQLEQGLVATPYIDRTDSYSKSTAGIQEDEPRYDYSLDNDAPPVLMLEPERQNLLTHSEYFSDWTDESASVTDNATTSPEGLINAAKLIPDSGTNGNRSIGKNFTGLSGVHTFSVFAKAAGHDYLALRMRNPGNSLVMFDLSDGSVENEVSGSDQYVANSAKIESLGNDWYRCIASFDPSESTTVGQLFVSLSTGIDGTETNDFDGDGTNGVFVYGAQLEKGEYATSYIPTYGSAATRKQDQALLGGYKAADKAWTVFMDVADFTNVEGNSHAGHFFFRSLASISVSSLFFYDTCFGYPKVGGGSGYVCGKLGTSPNSFTGKFAVTYDGESTMKFFVGGTLEATITDADPTYARGIKSGGLQYAGSVSRQSRTIKQLIIFPEALEDADAVSLTT